MSKKTILAIDLGTKTGFAITINNTMTSGTIEFKPARFEGGGMRYLRFSRWLNEVRDAADGIDEVYFEEVRRHMGVDAAHAYGGFMSHLTAWCELNHIPYSGIPVGTIKKSCCGKGNGSKQEVIAAVRSWGFSPKDDNEADALALLHYVLDEIA
jgi:Holliday junction resolvasome RuvABC endonuclease subunit